MIFSHVLYRLSYLGTVEGDGASEHPKYRTAPVVRKVRARGLASRRDWCTVRMNLRPASSGRRLLPAA